MKVKSLLSAAAAGLAGLGLLIPVDAVEAATKRTEPAPGLSARDVKAAVLNVELSKKGVLKGRVSDGKKGLSRAAVSVRQGRKELAKKLTDADGTFEFSGLKPGVYRLVTLHGEKQRKGGYAIYRIWSSKTAPPNSLKQVQLIPGKVLVRAQGPEEQDELFDENGNPVVRVRIVDNPGLVPINPDIPPGYTGSSLIDAISFYDIAVISLLTATLILVDLNYKKTKRIEDKVDALATPN